MGRGFVAPAGDGAKIRLRVSPGARRIPVVDAEEACEILSGRLP